MPGLMFDMEELVDKLERYTDLATTIRIAVCGIGECCGPHQGAVLILDDGLRDLASDLRTLWRRGWEDEKISKTGPIMPIGAVPAMTIYRNGKDPSFLIQAAYRVGFEFGRGAKPTALGGNSGIDRICKECLDAPVDLHLEDAEDCRTLRELSETKKRKGW